MNLELIGIFGAGLATFVTPCVLPLIPIYLSALVGGDLAQARTAGRGQLVRRALIFAVGFIVVFTLLGLTASALGAAASRQKPVLQGVGALIVALFGLKFLGLIRLPWLDRVLKADDARMKTRFGAVNALIMGVVFAAGWTPCVGPVLGSVLTYTAQATASPWIGAGYLAIYGLGFAVPLLAVAAFSEVGIRLLDRVKPHLGRIERIIGALLLIVAASMVWDLVPRVVAPAPQKDALTRLTTDGQGARQPAMVELYRDGCPYCAEMKPIVAELTRECHGKKVLVHAINLSQEKHRALGRQLRLVGVPTFVFLDKDGREVARLIGRQSPQALRQALSALVGEDCPGVGPVPGEERDRRIARPPRPAPGDPAPQDEVTACHSTNTTATGAMRTLNPSAPSRTETPPSVPSAEAPPGACSQDSP